MNPDSAPSSAANETTPPLPELHNTVLEAAQLEQLLNDIETCTEIVEILPKYAARGQVGDAANVLLAQARELLATRAVRGLQLRYRYEGADWWDTIMLVGEQFRVVRIRHDFTALNDGSPAGTTAPLQ